jgi:hypothetical protein
MGSKATFIREWIVFAISLGIGGHLVLAIVLHRPEQWPWHRAGTYALITGLAVYGMVLLGRFLWWFIRLRQEEGIDEDR